MAQDDDKQSKNTTLKTKKTTNVDPIKNRGRTHKQATGGKDESNIVFMQKS
jgi:hypothetical protein